MIRIIQLVGISITALVYITTPAVRAQGLNITSFGENGKLVFNTLNDGTNYDYRVEWAPSPAGPWSCFDGAAGLLQNLPDIVSGSVTSVVPMCYRVVALPSLRRDMVRVPAGTNSGTDPDGGYSLTVAEFYMDKQEVSKIKWDEVADWASTNGYDITSGDAQAKAADHPVFCVTWYTCLKWCNARSEKEGRTPCYKDKDVVYRTGTLVPELDLETDGYRLPTKTEWEYAARGGLKGKLLPWGNMITHSQANYFSKTGYSFDVSPTRGFHPAYNDGLVPYTSPVASFAANGYGLFDMAGNVTEWCWDSAGAYRSIRGGGWDDEFHELRCRADRFMLPAVAATNLGFRVVCH